MALTPDSMFPTAPTLRLAYLSQPSDDLILLNFQTEDGLFVRYEIVPAQLRQFARDAVRMALR